MLDVDMDTLQRLTQLAREFHAKEAVVIPDPPADGSDDWALQVLANHAGDLSLQEFRTVVGDLSPEAQQQLVALLWLGREDFAPDEWDEARTEAKRAWGPNTADYLLAHPLLSDYWERGLELQRQD